MRSYYIKIESIAINLEFNSYVQQKEYNVERPPVALRRFTFVH